MEKLWGVPGSGTGKTRVAVILWGIQRRLWLGQMRSWLKWPFAGIAPVVGCARSRRKEAKRLGDEKVRKRVEEDRRYRETEEKLRTLAAAMKKEWDETVLRPAA